MHRSVFASIRIDRCSLRMHRAGHNVRRLASSVPGMGRSTAHGLSRGNVVHVNTRIVPNSVLVNGVAPGNRASPAPRRGLLHTVFNSGTNSIGSTSLGTSPSLHNIIINGSLCYHTVGDHGSHVSSGTMLSGVSRRFGHRTTTLGTHLVRGLITAVGNGASRNIGSFVNVSVVPGNSGFARGLLGRVSFKAIGLSH